MVTRNWLHFNPSTPENEMEQQQVTEQQEQRTPAQAQFVGMSDDDEPTAVYRGVWL